MLNRLEPCVEFGTNDAIPSTRMSSHQFMSPENAIAMQYQKPPIQHVAGWSLCNVHLSDDRQVVLCPVQRISHLALFGAQLFIHSGQSLASVNAPIRQQHWIVVNMTLAVVSVWHVSRQRVELCAADWTYRCCPRRHLWRGLAPRTGVRLAVAGRERHDERFPPRAAAGMAVCRGH